jgi:hypothetical protein
MPHGGKNAVHKNFTPSQNHVADYTTEKQKQQPNCLKFNHFTFSPLGRKMTAVL